MTYQHTQIAYAILAIMAWLLGFTFVALFLMGYNTAIALFGGFIALVACLFHAMTIRVTSSEIKFGFALGLFGGRIALKDVAEVTKVTNSWRHGIGLCISHDGFVYAASGFAAVEIKLVDGTAYRLGTNDQENLYQAIMERVSLPEKPAEAENMEQAEKSE